MQAVVLAGGRGTRLHALTRAVPKSMISVDNRPFLEHQLDSLRDGGITHIVLCVGYLAEQIIDHFGSGERFSIDIEYSQETETLLGTAGAIKQAEQKLHPEFFVIYGDSYLSLDYRQVMGFFRRQGGLGLMTVYKNHDRYDTSNVAVGQGLVKKYSKVKKDDDMAYIDYGASILRREALDLIPAGQPYPLEAFFPQLVARRQLLAYEVHHRFYEVGSPQGLREFKQFILKGKQP